MNKLAEQLAPYEFWDLTVPPSIHHSRLYSLEPYGVGTPYIESLTSYISRLMEAHSVSFPTLIHEELRPLLKRQMPGSDRQKLGAFYKWSAHSLNGNSILARDFSQAVEMVTLRRRLASLTLLPWQNMLVPIHLMKNQRAWCPDCFAEWQAAGEPIYEPLLWYIHHVTLCPRHERQLVSRCPYENCGAILPVLARFSRLGYCSKCFRWLGVTISSTNIADHSFESEEWQWQLWTAKTLCELLAHNNDAGITIRWANLPLVIAAYLEQEVNGNLQKMATNLNVHMHTVYDWKRGKYKPQLNALMRLCYCSGIPLYRMLISSPELLNLNELETKSLPNHLGNYTKKYSRVPFDENYHRHVLETILTDEEQAPPSMQAVAKRLNRDEKIFRDHFPDLCKAISRNYAVFCHKRSEQRRQNLKNSVRKAINKIYSQGEYPNHDRVRRLIGKDQSRSYILFGRYWHEVMQELKEEKTRPKKKSR